jgi:hypothetical protein
MTQSRRVYLGVVLYAAITITTAVTAAVAHEWADDAYTKRWYENLMQPDSPAVSCCGEADSYWADDYEAGTGMMYDPAGDGEMVKVEGWVVTITDPRDDFLPDGRTRMHRDYGTRVFVPNAKVKWDKGNPTGHGILFLDNTRRSPGVYCYVPGAGA